MRYVTTVEGKTFVIEIEKEGEIIVNGQTHSVDMRRIEPLSLYSLLIDNLSHEVFIEEREGKHYVVLEGRLYTIQVEDERARGRTTTPRLTRGVGEVVITAPLPGIVVEVLVTAGQRVQAGEPLLILESMKMENRVHSPQDGTIKTVHIAVRDQVNQGQVLITLST